MSSFQISVWPVPVTLEQIQISSDQVCMFVCVCVCVCVCVRARGRESKLKRGKESPRSWSSEQALCGVQNEN